MQRSRLCRSFDQVSFRCCDPDILVNNCNSSMITRYRRLKPAHTNQENPAQLLSESCFKEFNSEPVSLLAGEWVYMFTNA